MISPDSPIEKIAEDRLGRAPFAPAIARAILASTTEESFVIGINGKWGSRKSSIVNLCVNELRTQPNESKSEIDILRFNPWNFADQNQLVLQFFRQFAAHLHKISGTKKAKVKNLVQALDQ